MSGSKGIKRFWHIGRLGYRTIEAIVAIEPIPIHMPEAQFCCSPGRALNHGSDLFYGLKRRGLGTVALILVWGKYHNFTTRETIWEAEL